MIGINQATRIAIFDNNKNIRNDILMLLSAEQMFRVVGVYSDPGNCVNDLLISKPHLVLMDIITPGFNGIETIQRLKKELNHIQILIQTSAEDDDQIYHSILAGASGYILKRYLSSSLVPSIKEIRAGGSPLSPSIARRVVNMLKQNILPGFNLKKKADYKLTEREKQVLGCIVKGQSYKRVGNELDISYETVRTHMKNIYGKLKVSSLTEVVAMAIQQQII